MFENFIIHVTNRQIEEPPNCHVIKFYDSELKDVNKSTNNVYVTKSMHDFINKLLFIRNHLEKNEIKTIIIYDYDTFKLPFTLKIYELARVFPFQTIHYASTNFCEIS